MHVLTWIRSRSSDVVDVFVYIVVLNLALEVVVAFKTFILTRLKGASIARQKAFCAAALWVLAAGSKILVLELIALVFGDAVSLGGFVPVTGLEICLLLARAGVRWLLHDKPPPK